MRTKLHARGATHGQNRGYTVIEVLMSLSVLAVGVIGVFSMEKITITSNAHAKNLAIATHIAQGWLGVLEAEASLWDTAPGSLNRTVWLSAAPAQPDWFRPPAVAASNFGPQFDELGNPTGDGGHFCSDLRISPLTSPAEDANGMGLRRVEVRVFWLRSHADATSTLIPPQFPCDLTPTQISQADRAQMMHFVHLSGAVRQVAP
jgi:prepilin-type N-terminal cleavage/methylation domain-containing protein